MTRVRGEQLGDAGRIVAVEALAVGVDQLGDLVAVHELPDSVRGQDRWGPRRGSWIVSAHGGASRTAAAAGSATDPAAAVRASVLTVLTRQPP
jgi:hypothetical protein